MKILISSSYGLDSKTGAAIVSYELADKMSKNNKVMFVCLGKTYDKKSVDNNLTIITLPSVFIKLVDAPTLSPIDYTKLKSDLRMFDPDIIHAQNIFLIDLFAIAWGLNNDVPVLITFHQLPAEAVYHVIPKLQGKRLGKVINYPYSQIHTRQLLENVNGCIALNSAVEKSIRQISETIKIYKLNNGLDLSKYFALKIKKQARVKRFVYLGSYFPRKNQKYLIESFSHLPSNYRLDLYGDKKSGGTYLSKLSKMILTKNIKNVSINDYVTRDKVHLIYRDADFLISASTKEAQSLTVIESLASSTPTIGLSNETIDELIDESNGLKIEKTSSPIDFARTVYDFVNSCDYPKIATNAKNKSKVFDIDIVNRELTKIYRSNIKTGPKPVSNPNKLLKYLLPETISTLIEDKRRPKYVNSAVGFTILLTTLFGVFRYLPRGSIKSNK